jgi:hypothetical protein
MPFADTFSHDTIEDHMAAVIVIVVGRFGEWTIHDHIEVELIGRYTQILDKLSLRLSRIRGASGYSGGTERERGEMNIQHDGNE